MCVERRREGSLGVKGKTEGKERSRRVKEGEKEGREGKRGRNGGTKD